MNEFSLSSYQLQLKKLLAQIVDVLNRNNMSYLAVYGTCLGAVRHGDISPWDDDIDIAVRREDYVRVKQLLIRECQNLYFWDYDEDPKCCLSFGRIFRRIKPGDTIEQRRAYIDLYIIDNVPNNPVARFLHRLLYTIIGRHLIRRGGAKVEYKTFTPASCLIYLFGLPLNLFPLNFLRATHRRLKGCLSRATKNKSYAIIGHTLVHNSLIAEGKTVSFGGIQICVPKDAEKYLEMMYGNWRQIPPEGQRGEHAYKSNGEVIVAMPDDSLRRG